MFLEQRARLASVLRRRVKMVKRAPDAEFFLELRRFVEFVQSNAYLRSSVLSLQAEAQHDKKKVYAEGKTAFKKLRVIRYEICSKGKAPPPYLREDISHFDSLSSRATKRGKYPILGLIDILNDLLTSLEQQTKPAPELHAKVDRVEKDENTMLAEVWKRDIVSPSNSWSTIMNDVGLIDLQPTGDSELDEVLERTFHPVVHGAPTPEDRAKYLRHLERVHFYLLDSIETGAAFLFALNQFKKKCEWYESKRIRDLCLAPKNPEKKVKEVLATFLFDQGLTPVLESHFGKSIPDISDLAPGTPMVIEAKIYRKQRNAILKGFNQIYQYASTIGAERAYYVFFNPEDVVVETPQSVLVNGRLIYLVQVELPKEPPSGNKMKIVRFTEEELLGRA